MDISNKVRTPIKGKRQRLRIALKAAGVTDKYETAHMRSRALEGDYILVMSRTIEKLPFTEFEGHPVRLARK